MVFLNFEDISFLERSFSSFNNLQNNDVVLHITVIFIHQKNLSFNCWIQKEYSHLGILMIRIHRDISYSIQFHLFIYPFSCGLVALRSFAPSIHLSVHQPVYPAGSDLSQISLFICTCIHRTSIHSSIISAFPRVRLFICSFIYIDFLMLYSIWFRYLPKSYLAQAALTIFRGRWIDGKGSEQKPEKKNTTWST